MESVGDMRGEYPDSSVVQSQPPTSTPHQQQPSNYGIYNNDLVTFSSKTRMKYDLYSESHLKMDGWHPWVAGVRHQLSGAIGYLSVMVQSSLVNQPVFSVYVHAHSGRGQRKSAENTVWGLLPSFSNSKECYDADA